MATTKNAAVLSKETAIGVQEKEVVNLINSAAANGEFSVVCYINLHSEAKAYLETNGYSVEETGETYVISWETAQIEEEEEEEEESV